MVETLVQMERMMICTRKASPIPIGKKQLQEESIYLQEELVYHS